MIQRDPLERMYAVEFSPSRGQVSVAALLEVMADNRKRFLENPKLIDDWTIIHAGTLGSCQRLYQACEQYLKHWGKELEWDKQVN